MENFLEISPLTQPGLGQTFQTHLPGPQSTVSPDVLLTNFTLHFPQDSTTHLKLS